MAECYADWCCVRLGIFRHSHCPATRPLVHRSARLVPPPSCATNVPSFCPREHIFRNSLTPNCITITEPASDRKEQKFNVPRSARIARQESRLGCRQIPAQAFPVQSVDLLKKLLRDSAVFLALRIDALREHDNVRFPCSHSPTCSAASP